MQGVVPRTLSGWDIYPHIKYLKENKHPVHSALWWASIRKGIQFYHNKGYLVITATQLRENRELNTFVAKRIGFLNLRYFLDENEFETESLPILLLEP